MAVSWGSAEGTNGIKVGIDIERSPATVVAGTSSVEVTCDIWVWTEYGYNDSQTLTLTGSFSGSYTVQISTSVSTGAGWSDSNKKKIKTVTKTITTSYTSSTTVTCTAKLTGNYQGSTISPSKTVSTVVDVRPYSPPANPTNVAASRISATTNRITWTNNPTASAPYSYIYINYSIDGVNWGDAVGYALPSWTAHFDHGAWPGYSYQYRVVVQGAGGWTAWNYSGWTIRTPRSPSSITATPNQTNNGDGSTTLSSISISVGVPAFDALDTPTEWQLEGWSSSTNAWTLLYSAGIPAAPYALTVNTGLGTDSSFQYRARVGNIGGYSPYVTSGTVRSKPHAPTGTAGKLSVTKTKVNEITLTWGNPSNIETGTEVYWSSSADLGTTWTAWQRIATTAANVTSYVHGSLDTARQHKYYVRNVVA